MINYRFNLNTAVAPLMDYLKKQHENRRFWRSIEISATLFLIAFFSFFAIRPAVVTISGLIGEIKSKELLTREMKQKINKIVQAQENFALVQQNYAIYESALPSTPRYSQAALQVKVESQKNNINIGKISLNLPRDQSNSDTRLQRLGCDFTFISDFAAGLNFIKNLSLNRRINQIRRVSISFADDKNNRINSAGPLVFNFNTDIFYFNQDLNEKK